MSERGPDADRISAGERRAGTWLAGVFALRMLGLFMILPVFALYAERLGGVTPLLAGLAIGAYGLSQAVFQIPFGLLSDRIGRKRVIVIGLLIFAAGSVVAALADTIYGVIFGRVLQGAGAISAAVMALAADLTREQHRTKVMAMIGVTIGMSFAAAMLLGPVLNAWIGVPGIFALTGVLALGGIAVVVWLVPQPVASHVHRDAEAVPSQFGRVLAEPELLRLNAGIFVLHLMLTATFVAVPLALRDTAGLASAAHWQVYFPALVLGMLLMVPAVIVAEKRRRMKSVFVAAVAGLVLAELGLALAHSEVWLIALLLLAFFTAFNVLEATLPSLISKIAPADAKGTAMGIYATSQFLGAFAGGALGGWLHGAYGLAAVFALAAGMGGVWLLIAARMAEPRHVSSRLLALGPLSGARAAELARQLSAVRGVAEAVVVAEEGVAYLKVDRDTLDEAALRRFEPALG